MSDQVRSSLPVGYRVVKRSVLGGLHHEYVLVKEAAKTHQDKLGLLSPTIP